VKTSHRLRTIAAVLTVIFVLVSVWAAYYVYSENKSLTSPPGQNVAATYVETANNGFTASLRPSVLYNNSTQVSGGNITLFTPITNWINVTLLYSVLLNRSVAINLHEALSVQLATPVWAKPLYSHSTNVSNPETALLSLTATYDVNVAAIVALAAAIDTQVGYNGADYVLSVSPVITGSLVTGGVTQSIYSNPAFNLSFDGSVITPSGLVSSSNGSIYVPAPSSSPTPLDRDAPYLALAAALAGLGASAWLVSRPLREEGLVPLDRMIAPYEEAIAETAAPPTDATSVPVAQFADLVKIADTLGKPILRPAGGDPGRPTFFVMDGSVAYSFRYPGGSSSSLGILERIQWEMIRLRSLPLDEGIAADARKRLSRAIDFLRDGDEPGATREVTEVSALLTQSSKVEPNPSAPGSRRP